MRIKHYKKNDRKWITQLVLVFKEIWRFDKKLIFIMVIEILISAASPFPYIILSKIIIDGLIDGDNYPRVIFFICLMFSFNYILSALGTLVGAKKYKMSANMTNMLSNEIRKKCMDMDFSMFNDTAIKDRASYAAGLAQNNNFLGILNGIKGIASNTIILVGVIAVVIQMDVLLLAIAIVAVALQCAV